MPRRTKLTDRLQADFLAAIRAGVPVRHACGALGIHEATFYRWLRHPAPRYRAFSEAVERAREEAYLGAVANLRAAMREDWRAAAWYLERRHPEEWGRPYRDPERYGRVAVTVDRTAPPPEQALAPRGGKAEPVYRLDLDALPPEALRAIVEQLEAQGGPGAGEVIDGEARSAR